MKKETKDLIVKIAMWFSPIFSIIMYSLPWIGIYKYTIGDDFPTLTYYSYLNIMKLNISLVTRILMWVSLISILVSLLIYLSTLIFKDKEKLFNKIASLTLLVTTLLLLLTPLFALSGYNYKEWIDFLTLPYGFAIVYEVVMVYFAFKKPESKATK